MDELSAVDEIIEDLQSRKNDNNFNPITIEIQWSKEYVVVKNIDNANTCRTLMFSVQQDIYDNSKEVFINELLENIVRFALLNISIGICVCDLELPENNQVIYETKSCKTFCEKVCEYTGLDRLKIFEVILPQYEAELYFYALLQKQKFQDKLIITNDSFNTATVNSLVIKMLSKYENVQAASKCMPVDNISFIGKVGRDGHDVLKKFVDAVVDVLFMHLKKNLMGNDDIFENSSSSMVVDLTAGDDDQYESDEILYDFNTSDIMDIDRPLDAYYSNELKSLVDGWDEQADLKFYQSSSYDEEIMQKYLNHDQEYAECREISTDIFEIADDEPQLISVDNSRKRKTTFETKAPIQKGTRTLRSISPKRSTDFRSDLPKRATKYVPDKKPIKSNLFNDEEVSKWKKAQKCDMKTILSTTTDYKSLDGNFRIPKKVHSSPKARRPIHEPKVDRQKFTNENIHYFDKCIENLVPYNSPSVHRSTPESVSKFINPDKSVVIEDDDDQNNNKSTENDHNSTGIRKRRLLNVSPKMIFKNRKQEESFSLSISPFIPSSSNRNSSYHRKT